MKASPSIDRKPLLEPFFWREGGYCNLLYLLLTADNRAAEAFRGNFSAKLSEHNISLGRKPVRVEREQMLTPQGKRNEIPDLIIELPGSRIGVEVKVHAASERPQQLNGQYHGLRDDEGSDGKSVHIVFITPKKSNRAETEVKPLQSEDSAISLTWQDVFDCFPSDELFAEDTPLISALVHNAKQSLPLLKPDTITQVTFEREAVFGEMKTAIALFNQSLASSTGKLSGCSWKPSFFRRPVNDLYYGPLMGADRQKHRGQYLRLLARYSDNEAAKTVPSTAIKTIPMKVGFVLELRGGARTYLKEFQSRIEEPPSALQPVGVLQKERGGLALFTQFTAIVGEQGVTVDQKPAASIFTELLRAYAETFGDFLLRDSRTAKRMRQSS